MTTPAQLLQSERMRFPGLIPQELAVMMSWLKLHEREYERIDGNVRVGAGFDPGPTFPENIRRMAQQNTQKRIDAVAYRAGLVTLIEVKYRATPAAVGQILTYNALWQHGHSNQPAPRLLIVAAELPPDMGTVLERASIPYELVKPDPRVLALANPVKP